MKFNNDFLSSLDKKLKLPLPGREAQYRMAHAGRTDPILSNRDARKACVMILLYPDEQLETKLVLIQRVNHKADRHSGQIGLPGGKLEATDNSLQAGALRELEEEVGVSAETVNVLGALSELYISVSNFLVYPFVGYVDARPDFVAQASEVQAILEAPLKLFLNKDLRKTKQLKLPGGMVLNKVPYFEVEQHTIWGATAMILNELSEIITEQIFSGND